MLLLEQLFRFCDFGKISLHIEFGEHRNEQFGCRARSTIPLVQTRKSKGAAQLESLRLLASCDVQRSREGILGTGIVGRVTAQQKLAVDAVQLGIEPTLTGLFH